VLKFFGPDRFHYVYHIGQTNSSDRVLSVNSDNDVQFDEEFYKFLVNTYGVSLREKVFFFVDNRNVIGKDIPFQLVFQKRFGLPMFGKSAVLAHDVDDFSKIWQAMGRSRTMNDTQFSIYTSAVSPNDARDASSGGGMQDIKAHALTRLLYIKNCDRKIAGNLSSIYQTLISLLNVSKRQFFFSDEIVNVFLLKMLMTIGGKVSRHLHQLVRHVLGEPSTARIFTHILKSKFQRSPIKEVAEEDLSATVVETLLGHIVQQKFEQRKLSNDLYDEYIQLLSGEQASMMEISYSKQQQKQKQKQRNRNQDSDTMDTFQERHRIHLSVECNDYFEYAALGNVEKDEPRMALSMPLAVPIVTLKYTSVDGNGDSVINVYPTVQFLYSHHIQAEYITEEIKTLLDGTMGREKFESFMNTVMNRNGGGGGGSNSSNSSSSSSSDHTQQLRHTVERCFVCQHPQYTIAALKKGVYIIGMKDQFNIHDLPSHPLYEHVQYVADEMGFILYSKIKGTPSVDTFGPYYIEQYILMELLSKQEVAQNVLDYYVNHKEQLQSSLATYDEKQGKGFICWRFLMKNAVDSALAAAKVTDDGQ
jgi:hypothetical protein